LLAFTNLNNETEIVTNIKGFKRKRGVNGDRVITFDVFPDESNEHSYHLIDNESIFNFDGEEYIIKMVNQKNKGNKSKKEVTAVHTFFNHMNKTIQHKTHNGSITFNAVLDFVFEMTDYTFVIMDSFNAERFENFGKDNCLGLFKKVLERYKAEFYIIGKVVHLKKEIGQKTDFQYRYGVNVKTISKHIDSNSLATVIKGYGGTPDDNGNYPLEETYVSPNVVIFGELEAKPVINENITTVAGMQERLKRDLIDEPQMSVKIDVVDLRATGYQGSVSEGDYGHLIYEPFDNLKMDARIVEIEEEYDGNLNPIKSNVTLSNIRNKATDKMVRFQQTSNTLERLLNGQERVPYNALEEKVRRSTEMLLNSATEIEYTENGIIARSKTNPDHLVLISSEGVGVSTDNGQSFRNAITGEGIVADLIVVGTMLFDRIKGGELTLGGPDNGNGKMIVLDANGEMIADLDAAQRGFAGELNVEDLVSPTVVRYEYSSKTFYVSDENNPNDDNDGLTWATPLATINEAIRRIPKCYEGEATIYLRNGGTYYGDITIRSFTGSGKIIIDGGSQQTKVIGNVFAGGNTLTYEIKKLTLNARSSSYAAISSVRSSYAIFRDLQVFGNGAQFGIDIMQGGYGEVINSGVRDVDVAVSGRYSGNIHLMTVSGKGAIRGVYAYGGFVTGSGQAPEGGVSNQAEQEGGRIFGTFTYPTATTVTPPSTPESKSEWSSTGSPKGDSWRPQFGGQWWNDGSVTQGAYAGFGVYKGLWLFGSNPSNAVTGKTIKSMRMLVKRKAGGVAGDVNVTFKPHTYTTRPSGEPSYQSPSTQAKFRVGDEKWITIPSSFYAGFQNGTSKGIGIYVNSSSQSNYAKFNVDAKLEITYS